MVVVCLWNSESVARILCITSIGAELDRFTDNSAFSGIIKKSTLFYSAALAELFTSFTGMI